MPVKKRPPVTKPEPEAEVRPENETAPASSADAQADHATLVTAVEEPTSSSSPTPEGVVEPTVEKAVDIGQTVSEWAKAPQRSEEKEKPRLGVVWAWAVIAFVVGAVIGGVGIYFFGGARLPATRVQVSPTPPPTPTPTPAAQPVRSDVKLQVLNASSVSGAAATAKDYLEGMGYKDVAVGNSDEEDVVGIRIDVKADKKQYLPLLEKDLQDKYDQAVTSGELAAGSAYDAVILLGKAE